MGQVRRRLTVSDRAEIATGLIALIGMPSALCNRRISAQSSKLITLQEC